MNGSVFEAKSRATLGPWPFFSASNFVFAAGCMIDTSRGRSNTFPPVLTQTPERSGAEAAV